MNSEGYREKSLAAGAQAPQRQHAHTAIGLPKLQSPLQCFAAGISDSSPIHARRERDYRKASRGQVMLKQASGLL